MLDRYGYEIRNIAGSVMVGEIRAESKQEAVHLIREDGYYITKIKKITTIKNIVAMGNGVKDKEIVLLCRQLAIMVTAGIPLADSLGILMNQTGTGTLRDILRVIYMQLQEGQTLSNALASYASVFPSVMVYMIAAGERGGVLDIVLNRLSVYLEKDYQMSEKLKSAMLYPLLLMSLSTIVLVFILVFIMPLFVTLFDNANVQLPLVTRLLLAGSYFMVNYGWTLILCFSLVGVIGYLVYQRPSCRERLDQILLKIPFLGEFFTKMAIARFSSTLAALLKGGVPIDKAVGIVTKIIGNLYLTKIFSIAKSDLQKGVSLSKSLQDQTVFEPMFLQMLVVGETTGELDQILQKAAQYYENDVDRISERMGTLLEPLMIIILGIIIGIIVLSIAWPMFDSLTYINQ
ncbi:type II secretion system F family protein [Propionispira raffinosivorans]|uniref:type II secretion system F family protein n=1 Tax=Propionispira raffinosivorans TaxID=86959 RepID=UPI000382C73F|nr:type II secretion system F family protein [Propionispira raffinosivorans]